MVVIEGMEVPSECRVCKLSNVVGNFCKVTRKRSDPDVRPEWCPIQEIPEGCGRLIDADALLEEVRAIDCDNSTDGYDYILDREDIINAPTIIERSREGYEQGDDA